MPLYSNVKLDAVDVAPLLLGAGAFVLGVVGQTVPALGLMWDPDARRRKVQQLISMNRFMKDHGGNKPYTAQYDQLRRVAEAIPPLPKPLDTIWTSLYYTIVFLLLVGAVVWDGQDLSAFGLVELSVLCSLALAILLIGHYQLVGQANQVMMATALPGGAIQDELLQAPWSKYQQDQLQQHAVGPHVTAIAIGYTFLAVAVLMPVPRQTEAIVSLMAVPFLAYVGMGLIASFRLGWYDVSPYPVSPEWIGYVLLGLAWSLLIGGMAITTRQASA
jgi:hypothetical protein